MKKAASPGEQLQAILGDVSDYLAYEKEEGLQGTEADPAVLQALTAPPAVKPRPPAGPRAFSPAIRNQLDEIAVRVAACTRCPLCETRTRTVPGQGHPQPEIAFVGEGPGADEDQQGLAFVGRAGQLLTRIITAMGLTRDEVWIGNIVKCRPPENRVPMPEEMAACLPYLREQLALLQPKVIVCLGATAVKGLLNVPTGITKLRGTWMEFAGIDVMPTFHPAFLLRNPSGKHEVWQDMQEVLRRLGRPIPPPARSRA